MDTAVWGKRRTLWNAVLVIKRRTLWGVVLEGRRTLWGGVPGISPRTLWDAVSGKRRAVSLRSICGGVLIRIHLTQKRTVEGIIVFHLLLLVRPDIPEFASFFDLLLPDQPDDGGSQKTDSADLCSVHFQGNCAADAQQRESQKKQDQGFPVMIHPFPDDLRDRRPGRRTASV